MLSSDRLLQDHVPALPPAQSWPNRHGVAVTGPAFPPIATCRAADRCGPTDMLGPARQTVVRGVTTAWTELGEGEPLVLLHGMGDSHRSWRNAAPHLARHYRVLMPDLPGHGLSGRPDAPYTLAWYAQSVLDWMDALGVERAHVCGHSFGGGVAQWMLLCDRARVRSLSLVAAGGLGREVAVGLRLAAIPFFGPLLTPHFMGVGTRAMMQQATGDAGEADPHEIARAVWMNSAPGTGRAFQRTVAGCVDLLGQHAQTWAHIDEVESLPPIALFWGEKDRMIPVRHCHASARRLEGARVFTYPACSHFLQLENAWEFSRDLLAFLDAPGRPATLRPPPQRGLAALTDVPSHLADSLALGARRLIQTLHAA
jgi:pimeloyl-ACP methyl ester carboxylesterase